MLQSSFPMTSQTKKDTKYYFYLTSLNLCIIFSDENELSLVARAQGIYFLASLLSEKAASDCVWRSLRETSSTDFFHLLLQCLETDEIGNYLIHCRMGIIIVRIWT